MVELSEVDWRIIQILQLDGRTTTKDIADDVGVSEAVVATRIRQLRERRVMHVTLMRDLYSQGFQFHCAVDVFVTGRRALTVARDLARVQDVVAVNLLIGKPEINVMCNARDREHLMSLVYGDICAVRGVETVAMHVALDIHKYDSTYGELSEKS